MANEENPFVFYLELEQYFNNHFFNFNHFFQKKDFILLPVTLDQLQQLASLTEQSEVIVICSVSSFQQMKVYEQKVRGVLKFFLKDKRFNFILISSFSHLDDKKYFKNNSSYSFFNYPLDVKKVVQNIVDYYFYKNNNKNRLVSITNNQQGN